MKIIINSCYGGFGINDKTIKNLFESGIVVDELEGDAPIRTNPKLIELIENGEDANTEHSRLKIIDIPDNATDYEIIEYIGLEYIICVINGKLKHLW